jgi:glycosyltransferase involved in cell wall biosynthesis
MHILYLSQVLPYPPDAGPKVRSYYTLRYLAQNHDLTLVSFVRSDDTPNAVAHLRNFCREVHTIPMVRSWVKDGMALVNSLVSNQSLIIRRDAIPAMFALVDKLLSMQNFDAVHADQLWMAQYALHVRRRRPGIKLVLDEHNACYQIFQRLAMGERNPLKRALLERDWRALRKFEAVTCTQFDHLVTVTNEDKINLSSLMQEITPGTLPARPLTIPICVDTSSIKQVDAHQNSSNILHLGTMLWPPNAEGVLWFAREVLPMIAAQVPGVSFTIAGKNPPESVLSLSTSENQNARGLASIQVIGYVADPQPYLEQAGAFIVPLLSGGGMRVKIVDAWRWGLPIISTRIGAEGIDVREGENILLADTPDEFAQSVVQVLTNSDLNTRLRSSGRKWVETYYDWRAVYPAWDEVYPTGKV